MSLSKKIYGIVGILMLLAVTLAAVGMWQLNALNTELTHVTTSVAPQIDEGGNLSTAVSDVIRVHKNICLVKPDVDKKKVADSAPALEKNVQDYREKLSALIIKANDETNRKQLELFDGSYKKLSALHAQIRELSIQNTNNKAGDLYEGPAKDMRHKASGALRELADFFTKEFNKAKDDEKEGAKDRMAAAQRAVIAAKDAESFVVRIHQYEMDFNLAPDDKSMDIIEADINKSMQSLNACIDILKAQSSGEAVPVFARFNEDYAQFLKAHKEILILGRANTNDKASALSTNEVRVAADECTEALQKLTDNLTLTLAETQKRADAAYATARFILIAASVLGILLAGAIAFVVVSSVARTLTHLSTGLGASAEQVAAAANQVSQSSQSMAEGASEQASSLEETSASLEELASMTRQNADSAGQARANSDQASSAAESGQTITRNMGQELATRIGGMNDAIQKIKTSADQTAKILKTIDEIAFQTNLLALNAAVEAARAGEAGKGFAVVAEEVRNLAQRSAEAAKSTAALIEESQRNADNGVKVSKEVSEILKKAVEVEIAKSFANTVEAASKVKQLIGEVAAASGEQAKGVDQINTAVSEMDKVTQANAANAEETASASEELTSQAKEMQDMVNSLIRLVRGADSVGATQTAQAQASHRTPAPVVSAAPKHAPKPQVEHKVNGTNRIATLNGKHQASAAAVIPLTDKELSSF